MTIRHMEILKAISETGSFTKAARLLYITQSAVSHAVQELETEAGTLLFDRLSKTIRLTEAGNLLLQEILPLLDSCKAVESKIKQLDRRALSALCPALLLPLTICPMLFIGLKLLTRIFRYM